MRVLGYGEDCLTLWALQNELDDILKELGDSATSEDCLVLYRPSFGRGGRGDSKFGEFDFIIATPNKVYLGEAKQDDSGEVKVKKTPCKVLLSKVQERRHDTFELYYKLWISRNSWTQATYADESVKFLAQSSIARSAPSGDTLLARNIWSSLCAISMVSKQSAELVNVCLIVDKTGTLQNMPWDVLPKFKLVTVDVSQALVHGAFVPLKG